MCALERRVSGRVRRLVRRVPIPIRNRPLLFRFRDESLEVRRQREQRGRLRAAGCSREVVREELRAHCLATLSPEQVAREEVRHVVSGEHRVVGVLIVRARTQVHCLRLEGDA